MLRSGVVSCIFKSGSLFCMFIVLFLRVFEAHQVTRCDPYGSFTRWMASSVLVWKETTVTCMKAFPPVQGLVQMCEISAQGVGALRAGQLFIQEHPEVLGRDVLNMIHMCYFLSGACVCFFGAAASHRVRLTYVCVCVCARTWTARAWPKHDPDQWMYSSLRQLFLCIPFLSSFFF